MSNKAALFECQNCGAQYKKWQGKCEECNKWNTIEEIEFAVSNQPGVSKESSRGANIKNITKVDYSEHNRVLTGISEYDRVIGNGFVPGQAILLTGEPGIGKSTLLLQVASSLNSTIYYICGEESPYQIKQRYLRLNLKTEGLELVENTDIETIINALSSKSPSLIIADSVNSLFSAKYKSSQGSISQVKETSQQLVTFAKTNKIPLILVGQINKEGDIAGPKTLEHLVDTVLNLEGDDNTLFRILRCTKNRYGSVNEVGLFNMDSNGLTPVINPSEFLLKGRIKNAAGSSICIIQEGNRSYAIEVQALLNKTIFGYPKRTSNGFNLNRLNLLSAVLNNLPKQLVGSKSATKSTKINLNDYDIYLNIASGIKVQEPAVDLAVCMALISAYTNIPLKPNSVFWGEVGLNSEIRPVKLQTAREKEAKNMNFNTVISPTNYKTLSEALAGAF